MEASDRIKWRAEWSIHKFRDPTGKIATQLKTGMNLEEVLEAFPELLLGADRFEGNVALIEGLQALIELICGISSPTAWDNSNARIGVGDSSAAEDASQTGLQGTSKTFKAMDATYPQRSDQVAEWRATFASGEGNHAWNEFTVVNAADDTGDNLNRKVEAKGTKASGETWTASVKITFS